MSDSAPDPHVPLADPKAAYRVCAPEIEAAVARVLESGRYILGGEVEAFEQEFAAFVGRKHCIGMASGTDALVAALRALQMSDSDYVVTVSHTAVATVAAIELAGAKPLLLDVDEATYTLDPRELAKVLARPPGRIAAILVVHLYGHAADMDAILPLALRYGIPVIEDCAQSHGARLHGKSLGALGTIAAFSFYPTKNLGCLGDGGAVVVDDPALAERLRSYRQYGWDSHRISQFRGACSRLDEMQAAILRVRLARLEQDNERRRAVAARYSAAFQDLPLHCPVTRPGALPVFHQYVIGTPERDRLQQRLAEHGVQTGIHYPVPVHLQPAYRGRVALGPGGLARTERIAREILSLPIFPQLTDAQVDRVIAAMNAV